MHHSTSKARVLSLFKTLLHHYGPQEWWPAESAWEMMVGAILTQNTSWMNVEKAITGLRRARVLTAHKMARLPRRKLEALIRPSGYFRQKAHRLQLFARHYLADKSFVKDRMRLLTQHGVGPETADSILLYAGGRPSFVVDAYTRRLGHRLGWFQTDDYNEVQAFFMSRLPRKAALYNEFHALIVRLAKDTCQSRNPHCTRCPVQKDCVMGKGKAR